LFGVDLLAPAELLDVFFLVENEWVCLSLWKIEFLSRRLRPGLLQDNLLAPAVFETLRLELFLFILKPLKVRPRLFSEWYLLFFSHGFPLFCKLSD
jgi:hypothetical protein